MVTEPKPKRRKTAKQIQQEKNNFLTSLTRTFVPIVVAAVSSSFLGPYIDQDALKNTVSGIIAALYYTGVRYLERYYPQAGLLLGSTRQPNYPQK